MLESLDSIPWAQLRCLTGHAGHVPEAVRGLLSDKPDEVRAAYWRLENFVVVQGYLYDAAEHLVPVLFEALPLAADPTWALELLFQIGNGHSADEYGRRARCHAGVVAGLEQWLTSPDITPSNRAYAEEYLRDLYLFADENTRRDQPPPGSCRVPR